MSDIQCPEIAGVEFLKWDGQKGRASGAIISRPVSAEVMQGIYRRLYSSARLDLDKTKRLKVWAYIHCEDNR